MSAANVTFSATYGDNKTLETLADLIKLRSERLSQTTEQATRATAINVLKAIRARTRVADPKDKAGILVARRSDLIPSWRHLNTKTCVPCIRVGNGHGARYTGDWYNATDHYGPGVACYFIHDMVGKDEVGTDKRKYVLIANSPDEARAWAAEKHYKRVARYAGTAKTLLGVVMNRVSTGQGGDTSTTSLIASVIDSAAGVSVDASGFSSGKFSILVQDLLRYAVPAVDGGAQTIDFAMKKAANQTAAIVNKLTKTPLDEPIDTPFPEIKGK